MTFDDIEQAFARGRISESYAWNLEDFLAATQHGSRPDSPVREVLQVLTVKQRGQFTDELPALAPLPAYAVRAELRPGMVELFHRLHRGAVRNVDDPCDLSRAETFQQVQSLVRSQTQSVLARSIRDVMKAMDPWLDRDAFVIPCHRRELVAPDAAERVESDGVLLAILPWKDFAALYDVDRVAPLLALFRRCAERMGRHFTDRWFHHHGATPDAKRAADLLQGLRHVGFGKTMGNGFASGVLDVVNPLHLLVVDVLRRQGPAAFTPEFQEKLIQHHVDFSAFLATFSLACVAGLENLMGVPATDETLKTVRQWTAAVRDIRGKGFPLDCHFAAEYFTIRTVDDGSPAGIPIIDFNIAAFPESELARMASQTIRLGCPSLGNPHRQFTRAMCRAYFQAVFPTLAAAHAD
jgi:hypothetical protein